MPQKPKLIGFDYFNVPHKTLIKHPDYNAHVFRIIQAIGNMGNEQLEQIDVSKLVVKK